MARIDPQVNIRIPARLKALLDSSAKKSGRSLTAEILYRLESTFQKDEKTSLADLNEKLKELNREMSLISIRLKDELKK